MNRALRVPQKLALHAFLLFFGFATLRRSATCYFLNGRKCGEHRKSRGMAEFPRMRYFSRLAELTVDDS